ncbi:MAG: hypothetical protein K6E36_05475 [Oscillospiraceae bacterium]|nr:hypothetical protein [Oscillospiraceae bacterium]
MPFINVKTNVPVSAEQAEQVKSAFGSAITAIPGKSEGWLMVGIEGGSMLWFKGTDKPAAMTEVSLYGSASPNSLNQLTAKITEVLSGSLGIPSDRIYVSYHATPNWGWNGSNF